MLRVVLSALLALGGLAFDLREASLRSAGVALAAVLVFALGGWTGAPPRAQLGRYLKDLAKLSRLQAALLVGLWLVLGLRAFILYRSIAADESALVGLSGAARTYDELLLILVLVLAFVSLFSVQSARMLLGLSGRPALALVLSFATLIVVVTLLLVLPVAVRREGDIHLIDAFFMATSAVCVTGLATVDPWTTYTFFGHAALLLGVQLGGLGIMTIAALAATTGRGSLRSQARFSQMLQSSTVADLRSLVRTIVLVTLGCEALGAIALALLWSGDPRLEGRNVLWQAVFHSVTAFCNAGFALFSDNLAGWRATPGTLLVVSLLIVAGGIGFPVLRELFARARWRPAVGGEAPPRLSLLTRTSVTVAALLFSGGFALIALLESDHAMADWPWWQRALGAAFTSVSARTAGFNTVDLGAFREATLLVVMALMFIGGSPGSCAGGIKTTTAAVIGASLRGELRGSEPHLFNRALPPDIVRGAIAVAALSLPIVLGCLLVLSLSESLPFERLAFEAVSAFGTVGLSTGITPELSGPGKLAVSATMFLGRVGPLTIALAVARARRAPHYRLARESLTIG
jgi:trk system potassium uptake protein TrkH